MRNFIRSQIVWVLLLGRLHQTDAQNAPVRPNPTPVKPNTGQAQPTALAPDDPQRPVLMVIQQGLQGLPLSRNENLKTQTLQSIAQSLKNLAGSTPSAVQKEQIRDLFSQTIQATSGVERPDLQAELLKQTAGLAIEVGDSALTHRLLNTIDQVANTIEDPVYKAYALSELARLTTFVGDQSTARHLLAESQTAVGDTVRLTLSRYRLVPLGQALDSLTLAGRPSQDSTSLVRALQQLGAIEDLGILASAMNHLFVIVAQRSDKSRQHRAYDQLLRMAHTQSPEMVKAQLLKALAQAAVDISDSTARHARLIQLKQEAQGLTDKVAQGQALADIYLAAMRSHDSLFRSEEFLTILSGARQQAAPSQPGNNPFQGLGELFNARSLTSIRLRAMTQILGTMALVATQLDDQSQATQLLTQTRQMVYGIDNAPELLSALAITTAQAAAQPSVQAVASRLLRQAQQLAAGIDDPKIQTQTWGKLAGWAAQAGDLDQARALLTQGMQAAFQPPRTDWNNSTGNAFAQLFTELDNRAYSVAGLIQPVIQLEDTSSVRALLAHVVGLVQEQPNSEAKASAYTGILYVIPTRSRQLTRLPNAGQTADLLSGSLRTVRAVNNPKTKLSLLSVIAGAATEQSLAQAQSFFGQLTKVANTLDESEKNQALKKIVGALSTAAKEARLAGNQGQSQALFSQAQQLLSGMTQERGQAASTLIEKKAQTLAVVRNPATFQGWLSELDATVKAVKVIEPYAASWSVLFQVLIDQARQETNAQLTQSLLTQALTIVRQTSSLSNHTARLSSLTQAAVGVFSQDQLRTLLIQTLQAVNTLANSTSKTQEYIALGRAMAQRKPVAQANELIDPILQAVQRLDNQNLKVYALKGLTQVDQRTGQQEPTPLLWQRIVAMANTLDDAAALAQTQNTLDQVYPVSELLLPKGQAPSLVTQQQALKAANPSVRAEVLSAVAGSMAFWNQWSQANALLDQVKPAYKIQLIQGMLMGWIRRAPAKSQ